MIRVLASLMAVSLVLFVDRTLKIFVVRSYLEGEGFWVVPGIFRITRVNNPGAAFGLLKDAGILLVFVSFASLFFLIIYLFRSLVSEPLFHSRAFGSRIPNSMAWSLLVAGALSNLYDRLHYGYVVDFFDFRFWPVFNVADVSICTGAFFILLGFLVRDRGSEKA